MTEPQVKVHALQVERARGLVGIGPPPMVIEELIPVGAIVLVSGAAYSGKTFFALEAAKAVATQAPFMGKWKVERPGNVLIVEQDSPRFDTGRAMWSMVARPYEEEGQAAREGEGSSIVDPIHFSWHPGLDLASRMDAERIAATANALYTWRGQGTYQHYETDGEGNVKVATEVVDHGYRGTTLIVLDSARSLHQGKEDKSDDMERVIQNIKYIRERTGAAILLIAHDNATGEKTRGSTAIPAGVDVEYAVTKRKRSRDHGVFVRKARAIAPQEFRYTITTEEDPKVGTVKTVAFKEYVEAATEEDGIEEDDTRAELMRFIADEPRELQRDLEPWAKEHGVGERTMKKWLAEGKETGYLTATYRNEGRARFATYAVRGAVEKES